MVDVVMDRELRSGAFERQRSHFRDWVGLDPRTGQPSPFPVAAGRYHLYVALACPWSHRAVIVHELAGLQDAVGISYLAPFRDERGWAFTGERFTVAAPAGADLRGAVHPNGAADPGDGADDAAESWSGEYVDDLHGWSFMSEAYRASDPAFDARITVPVLWDTATDRIVSNESSEIVRMLYAPDSLGGLAGGAPDGTELAGRGLDLNPPDLAAEIETLNRRIYDTVNNGVYRAGFARRQDAYEEAFAALFESLAWLEELLGRRRYLAGSRITEADWRLFPTLVRFDEVYHLHFRCNRRRVVEYPNLWGYARELYQWPGLSRTVSMDQIKRHYYTTHDELNPKRIIPIGPAPEWLAPHGRG